MAARKNSSDYSYSDIFTRALHAALIPRHLVLQGCMLVLSLLALFGFTLGVFLPTILLLILSVITGFVPFLIFIPLAGLVIWILGLTAISSFLSGVQYHLCLQAISRKRMDFDLAWKLSSARWKDAFVLQGSIIGMVLALLILSIAAILWITHFSLASFLAAVLLGFPAILGAMAGLPMLLPVVWGIFAVGVIFILLQPFLAVLTPTIFFEDVKPLQAVNRTRKAVAPHYWKILLTMILLFVISFIVSTVSQGVGTFLSASGVVFPLLIGLVMGAWAVQLVLLVFNMVFALCTQTLIYLKVASPPVRSLFVSQGTVSRTLSLLAENKPYHSPHFPVKWKRPGNQKKGSGRKK